MFISLRLNQASCNKQGQCELVCSSCSIAMSNKVFFVLIVASSIIMGTLSIHHEKQVREQISL